MPRTSRRKISKGIYADNHGYAIVVSYKGRRKEKRYKRGTTNLRGKRAELLHKLKTNAPVKGSFKANAESYLNTLPKGKMKENRTRECAFWYTAIGALPRDQVTRQHLEQVLNLSQLTASSKRKAMTAYKAVCKFHGDTTTAIDDLKRPKEHHQIRGIPQSVVTMILRKMPRCKTRARLKVLARTGLPHAQIAALKPYHLDLEKRELTVTPRRKGHGVPARTLPITHKAVRAFKEFQMAKAWGSFSRHSMWRMFGAAVERAKASWKGRWPAADKLRPYDLRHAFLTEAYRRSKDLRATAELGLHADLTMTARYAAAAVTATAQAARDAMEVPRKSATKPIHDDTFRTRKSSRPQIKTGGTLKRGRAKTGRK